jgi:ABC-type glycerol-3-phosphate transport system permease component
MNTNKIIGYVLLIVGILLVVVPLWHTYNIFTAKTSAPLVFMNAPVAQSQQDDSSQSVQVQINEAVKKQIGQIISANSITKILNLISWSIFVSVLILAGGVIAGVGTKLIKS